MLCTPVWDVYLSSIGNDLSGMHSRWSSDAYFFYIATVCRESVWVWLSAKIMVFARSNLSGPSRLFKMLSFVDSWTVVGNGMNVLRLSLIVAQPWVYSFIYCLEFFFLVLYI